MSNEGGVACASQNWPRHFLLAPEVDNQRILGCMLEKMNNAPRGACFDSARGIQRNSSLTR
jgi:hypothetical protein